MIRRIVVAFPVPERSDERNTRAMRKTGSDTEQENEEGKEGKEGRRNFTD